ncbi:MAG TPA: hypothetical protein ENI23_13295 [bacterium]|nr:hypothetical protein [bacterium]
MVNRLAIDPNNRLALPDRPVINSGAVAVFELLNDPDSVPEQFMDEDTDRIYSENIRGSDTPQKDRLRLTENMMIATSIGTDLATADATHDQMEKEGFLKTLKEEWTTERVLGKVPIVGALQPIAESIEAMKAAERLSSNFDYSKAVTVKQQREGFITITPRVEKPFFHNKEADAQLVEDYIERVTKDRTFLGKVAAGLSILPTWMLEFAMTGGLASFGKEATKKGMIKLLNNYAKTKVGATALRATGWVGGAITRTTLGLPSRVVEKGLERQLQVRVGLREQEGWATSFATAWGDVVIESASEEAGQAITAFGAKALGVTKFGSKFVDALRKAWIKTTGGTAGKFNKALSTGGYSNLLGEIGEEGLGSVLRAITDVEDFGAGAEAGVLERLAAATEQFIEELPVTATVLAIPFAGQSIVAQIGKTPTPEATVAAPEQKVPVTPTQQAPPVKDKGLEAAKGEVVIPTFKEWQKIVRGPTKETNEEFFGTLEKQRDAYNFKVQDLQAKASGTFFPSQTAQPPTAEGKAKVTRPSKAQSQIDAKKFLKQVAEHEAQVKGEMGIVDVEPIEFDIEKERDEGLGATWYENNRQVYKKSVLKRAGEFAKQAGIGIEKVITPISTRLFNINPTLFRATRRHTFNVMTRTTEQVKRAEIFLRDVKKIPKKELVELDLAFKNSDGERIGEILAKHNLKKQFREVRKILDELFESGKAVGLNIDYRKNYMPRVIKDAKGFLDFVRGTDDWPIMEEAIKRQEKARNRPLTDEERAVIANTMLRGYRTSALTIAAPGATKTRTVPIVDAKLNQFYLNFKDSLIAYIQVMNESIAAREFFGKETKTITKTRGQLSATRTRFAKAKRREATKTREAETKEAFTKRRQKMQVKMVELENLLEALNASDLSDTIGAYVDQLIVDGEITHSQERQVIDLLQGLFNPSGIGNLLGGLKTLTYITHLGSPLNAVTQIEDLALSFYRSPLGFLPEAVRAFINKSEITPADIGITTIAQELSGVGMMKRTLTEILRITGFEKIDRVGKQTFINTVIKKMRKQAQKPTKSFGDRIRRVFGDDSKQVIEDLKSGKMTDNIKYLAFNQLLDVQPLALTEMPEAYNRSGNLRILYTLKTFMIRQFDFIRGEALADMRHKETFMRGFGRLVWLTFALSLFGAGTDAIKDFMRGRKFDIQDSVVDNILRRFFFSKYQISTAKRDGILRSYLEGFLPPTALIDRMVRDMIKVWDDPTKANQSLRSLPIVGELLYQWWFADKKKSQKSVKFRTSE